MLNLCTKILGEMKPSLSDGLRRFIFDHIDSVALLELTLLMLSNPTKSWTIQALASELRSNTNSVEKSLFKLTSIDVVFQRADSQSEFYFRVDSPWSTQIVELAEIYPVQKHKILEMIVSPMKIGRDFADAFRRGGIGKSEKSEGKDD